MAAWGMAFSKVDARRLNSARQMSGESTALLGQADSVAETSGGQNSSAQHATKATLHLPRVAPARATGSLQAGSVVLKNGTG